MSTRFIVILSLLTIFTFVNNLFMKTKGNFIDSCQEVKLKGTFLEASCKTQNGNYRIRRYDLRDALGVGYKKLIWQEKGKYSDHVTNCELIGKSTLQCLKNKTKVSIDLNERIKNWDGYLKYL